MKINVNAIEKLETVINAAQERAKVRTIKASSIAFYIEAYLEPMLTAKGLPKKYWQGLKLIYNSNAQAFPNAYKGSPEATLVTIERFASGWFVTNVWRGYCTNKKWEMATKLTEDQEKAILKNFYEF